ncbi:hypothetical protein KSP40_PGU003588 [Platanthera guangdongensis]|uniref:Uncharacterized protein n=1 Tax=Platanthera guangdongensis TaxID=2320717 RepID=A0ABR2MU50_9ASPA
MIFRKEGSALSSAAAAQLEDHSREETGRRRRRIDRQYSPGRKKGEEESRCRSFSSSERARGASVRRGVVTDTSAYEIHYTVNRAAEEEQRKKTLLPYQSYGMFSCLRFNPAIGSILISFL